MEDETSLWKEKEKSGANRGNLASLEVKIINSAKCEVKSVAQPANQLRNSLERADRKPPESSARQAAVKRHAHTGRLVLGYLAADKTAHQIITEFPDLTREQIAACIGLRPRTG